MRGHLFFALALLGGCNAVLGNEQGQLRDDLKPQSGNTPACARGFADCNGDASDGCETDLSEPAHCGACGYTCGPTSPLCASGRDGTFACASGCPPEAPSLCGYQCVDNAINPSHCGTCGHTCPGSDHGQPACRNGACDLDCTSGYHACNGKCAAVTDPTACGDTCTPCKGGPNGSPICNDGACSIACIPGFADCDKDPGNGCETAVLQDSKNCGSCGHACTGSSRCVGGFCLPLGNAAGSPQE